MSNRKIIINEICKLNADTIGINNTPDTINYLDTSSITKNKIVSLKKLSNLVEPFPSRAKRKVKKNTIIYSTVRPDQEHFGIIQDNIEDLIVSTGFVTLDIIDNDVDPKYLFYNLTKPEITNYLHTLACNNVTSYPSINPSDLGNLVLLIPANKTTQQKIASILSALDSKIDLNNRINSELEAMAKTLYDYWFVQFDFPFDFSKDKSKPDIKPYNSSGGKMVWNEELKREVPEGWEVVKMSEWLLFNKSGDWGKEEKEGNFTKKVTCIRGADINGLNGLAELKPPERYILEKNAFKVLEPNDIIIEISGGSPTQSTGRLAFITKATIDRFENPLICSNFCKPITLKNPKNLFNFVYYWNSLYENGVFFGYEGKTSGIKNLLLESFVNSYYTVVPEAKIVDKFYDFMHNIQVEKQTLLAQNQTLSSLRDWLLPMLMNGQVRVGDLEEDKLSSSAELNRSMVAEERGEYGE